MFEIDLAKEAKKVLNKRDKSPKRGIINKPLHVEWKEKEEEAMERFRREVAEEYQKLQEKFANARKWVYSQAELRPDKTKFKLTEEYYDAKRERKRLKREWKTDLEAVLGALVIDPPTILKDGFDIMVLEGKLTLTMDDNDEREVEATELGRTFFANLQTYLEEHYGGFITIAMGEQEPESGFILYARNDKAPCVGTDHIEGEVDFVDMPRVFDVAFIQAIVCGKWGKVKYNQL
jgi:hypothetical protein